MFIFLLLIFTICLIYFIYMVCIQIKYISNINLLLGMDINKLYLEEEKSSLSMSSYINHMVKTFAMYLYKLQRLF
ncbi:hypothetical protein GCM10022323_19920 [Asaccharospora irregularis DSM 2635]